MEAFFASGALVLTSAFLFGLLIGSFLNVVILRLPAWMEWRWKADSRDLLGLPAEPAEPKPPGVVMERSHCPRCGHKLAWWENVPLLSFALLRGRCRGCGVAISWQYPIIELLTGLTFVVVVWRLGIGVEGIAALVFTAFLIGMSGIDLRTTLLPDGMTLPLLWLGLLLAALGWLQPPETAIVGAVVGYLSLWSVYWLFKLLTGKEGMGYGDFKLLAAIGAWCGWQAILPVLLMSSLIGAVVGGTWLALRGRDRATPIPFGPFLAGAGWVQLVFAPDLLGGYLRVSGLG
ncbi:MAG TPA: A24 family peptidase [Xanthomonadaceae bacterium]|nr:A24 family peptidase [Xanthomonadaceae bacterium]